ncbi:hypothetical protein H5V45_04440 [Nocardioides sp. KIGAM211]|uniref:Serine/arginine repetitive matrix protein 2 n=1 Tax=Nocardioides luti TaxID=2761101 RepID=A0A7X0RE08_9ACTN|nr:hypothetical protein [Nocardioides luti]MBB6626568.1 hypothetical protein [Nocardioides luti]
MSAPYPPPQQPPYGVPQAPLHQPPGPPRKPRPSGWWFVLGGALVVAAIAVGVTLVVLTLRGFLTTDATVSADDQPHTVSVGTDRDRLLWATTGSTPQCTVVDRGTGREVATSSPGAAYTKSDGSGSWTGFARFDPGSGTLEVTCTAAGGDVQIGPAPELGSFVGGIFATILVPLVLGLLGLLVLIVTGVRFATGAPRDRSGNNPA